MSEKSLNPYYSKFDRKCSRYNIYTVKFVDYNMTADIIGETANFTEINRHLKLVFKIVLEMIFFL